MRRGGTSSWYAFDALGTTRALTGPSQVVTDSYAYDAFGNTLASSGTTVNPYRYVGALGYYSNGPSGLMQLGARYYAPDVGRFITADPIGYSGGLNLYNCGYGDPINLVDPSGLGGIKLGPVKLGSGKPWVGIGRGAPWLIFGGEAAEQLGRSGRAVAGGLVTGLTAGIKRPDWSDPTDPYRGFSRTCSIGAGGSLLASGVLLGAEALAAGIRRVAVAAATQLPKLTGPAIVIRQSMSRVRDVATRLGAYAHIYEYGPEMETADEGCQRAFNEAWIRAMIQKGYTVIDIGANKAARAPSQFYEMEIGLAEKLHAHIIRVPWP